MPFTHAQIPTERASRYLVQFCKHAAAMGSGGHTPRIHRHAAMARGEVRVAAEWSDTAGTVTFTPWGRCGLVADKDTLTVRIDAADEDGLAQIRDVVERDLQRFSSRDPITVTWQGSVDTGTSKPRRHLPRTHLQTVLLGSAAVLVIALHIGLAGAVVAHSRWTGIALDVMAALVVVKIGLIAWTRFARRHRGASKTPTASGKEQA
jgi:hypothetical protein